MTSEISVTGHTSRPSGYIVRKYKDPKDENSAFLPDEVYENDFKHGGLGYEADAFARTLKGESTFFPELVTELMVDGLLECPRMPHDESLLMAEVCFDCNSSRAQADLTGV